MLSISDIMTRDVCTLSPTATVEEAAWIFSLRGISGAPVRDRNGRLVGVLSRTDLTDPERIAAGDGKRCVQEIMTPALFTLRAGDPAMQAIRLMVREGIHRIIVIDDEGRLDGIVTPMDVLKALAHGQAVGADEAVPGLYDRRESGKEADTVQ